jgi:type III secretion protein C
MTTTRRSPRALRAFVLACTVLCAALPVHADTPPWPDSPFSYISKDQPLDRVLAGFAKSFSLELKLETALPENLAPLSGRSAAVTPSEFLNQLGAAYGLTWYYHAGALHISRTSERVTRLVPLKGMSAGALKRTFAEMGIVDGRFGWGEVEERSSVMVSGPRSYVERIERAMSGFAEPQAEQQIMVFRLKHASVEDRTISYRDKQLVTPGVATMLRSLLGDGAAGGVSAVSEVGDTSASNKSSVKPLAGDAGSQAPAAAAKNAKAEAARAASRAPMIQSDIRLNAILIKDRPQNAAIYKELIDTLDVPSSLIEIEAAIVDVNTSNMSDLGVDWSGRSGKHTAGFDSTGATLTLVRGAINPTTVLADAGNFLMARIKALETRGAARIVSRPFILTQDNMGALVDLADTFYVQTAGERVATVTAVSVGITLRVTPRIVTINGVRTVQLAVDIEDGLIQDTKVGALPTVRRSTIGTQAVVGENESLLIGGFNSESSFRSRDQVPVLGDIPVVGTAFSKTVQTTEKRERLFLITPKIVADRYAPAAAVSAAPTAAPVPALALALTAEAMQPARTAQ